VSGQEAEEEHNADDTPQSGTKRVNVADASSAVDFMSRGSCNYISQIRSGLRVTAPQRYISSAFGSDIQGHKESKTELDSHSDTTVAGSSCRVLEYTEKFAMFFPFQMTLTLYPKYQLLRS
jgi:hypothetical protein